VIASVLAREPQLLADIPLASDRDEVLRFQGYKPGLDLPSEDVLALYEAALADGESLMRPRLVYGAVPVADQEPDRIRLAGGVELHIPEIHRFWGRLEAVGIGICTIGDALEWRSRQLFEAREFPLAVMLDSVGSAAVECLAEWANDYLCQVAIAERLKVTNRISPGYAGWPVEEQRLLFRLCPGALAGVSLNDSCLMIPLKSISFLVGIGPEARVDHYFTQCRRCWMAGCAYRRAPAIRTVQRASSR
jgi:hypothetical protein